MSSLDEYAIGYRHAGCAEARIALMAATRPPWRCSINDGAAAPAMLQAPTRKGVTPAGSRHGAGVIPRTDIGKVPAHIGKVRRQHKGMRRQHAKVKRSLGKVHRQHGTVKRQHANVRRSLGKVKRQHESVPAHLANRHARFHRDRAASGAGQ
ncbi:MAG: hypothetical protein PHW25_17120 [Zoogloea sp.]|uniref:hypothetical protein n=1 Tax=Zoogloea sp. TaxID=49181 RepID=UPI00260561C7|nr:hypothetical protein [Zoogloea sp.]MDD3328806.1 hypothetical protein [Zoogloea sp.]